jgi:hypothetical protein
MCVDDTQKPIQIPQNKWIVKNETYHITHIFKQIQQPGIQGAEIAERDLSMHFPYNCFRLDRFAFRKEDLPKVFQMIQDCSELNDIDISTLVESLETIEN